MLEVLENIILTTISIFTDTASWLVISFIFAGLLRNILTPEKFQRSLGNTKISSLVKATISGLFLPICSCGVIPLGFSMYYSGGYLGPTLAFMTATPIINPVALLLTFGMLGPKIGIIYLITGLIAPIIVGIVSNKFAGKELCLDPSMEENPIIKLEEDEKNLLQKLVSGMQWAFTDLGYPVSKYVVPGMILAGIILALVPQSFIQGYLGNPGMVSLAGIAVLSGVMYVCAVGHIPFIAAIIAAGASPGTAITFLMTGAATNIPELISMYKLIGKRAVLLYFSLVTGISLLAGYIANLILLPGFVPFVNLEKTQGVLSLANSLILATPDMLKNICGIIVFIMFLLSIWPNLKALIPAKGAEV